jgi:hypothetical protein
MPAKKNDEILKQFETLQNDIESKNLNNIDLDSCEKVEHNHFLLKILLMIYVNYQLVI